MKKEILFKVGDTVEWCGKEFSLEEAEIGDTDTFPLCIKRNMSVDTFTEYGYSQTEDPGPSLKLIRRAPKPRTYTTCTGFVVVKNKNDRGLEISLGTVIYDSIEHCLNAHRYASVPVGFMEIRYSRLE